MKRLWFTISLLSVVMAMAVGLFFKEARADGEYGGVYCYQLDGCSTSAGCPGGASEDTRCRLTCHDGSKVICGS